MAPVFGVIMSANEIASNMNGFLKQAKLHRVQKGETAWNIARNLNLTLPELQLANPQANLAKLQPGELLYIPEGAALEKIKEALKKPSLKGTFDLNRAVQDAAVRYGISPAVLKALIFVESSNNPRADSGQAQGLTQLTPYAQRVVGVQDPFDPVQSVYGGAHWLSIAKQEAATLNNARPEDQLKHALMIYHAGKPAVQAWINRGSPEAGFGQVQGKTLSYPKKILQMAGK